MGSDGTGSFDVLFEASKALEIKMGHSI